MMFAWSKITAAVPQKVCMAKVIPVFRFLTQIVGTSMIINIYIGPADTSINYSSVSVIYLR